MSRSATDAASPRTTRPASPLKGRVGPHSRLFRRGAIAGMNGNSAEAKFVRTIERALVEHIGGSPSATQRLLIGRVARLALRLELYEQKLASETLTPYDAKIFAALNNSYRLGLRDLGMKGAAAKVPTIAEAVAIAKAARQAREAA